MKLAPLEKQALLRFTLPVCIPDQTCFFAGQKLTPRNADSVREKLPHEIEALIQKGVDTFISGGFPGFELDAAEAVLSLKTRFPSLRLFFILPYPDFTATWKNHREADRLRQLLPVADAHIYTAEKTGKGRYRIICMAHYAAYALCALQNNRQGPAAQAAYYAIRGGADVKNLVESSALLQDFIEREEAFQRVRKTRSSIDR